MQEPIHTSRKTRSHAAELAELQTEVTELRIQLDALVALITHSPRHAEHAARQAGRAGGGPALRRAIARGHLRLVPAPDDDPTGGPAGSLP